MGARGSRNLAWRGWLRLAVMLAGLVFIRLPGWWIRGVRARRDFRRALRRSGVSPETARRLAGRYRLPGLRGLALAGTARSAAD